MSLVAIESGSGTMVLESEASSLLDVPREVFRGLIAEVDRESGDPHANRGLQKALLSLEGLFRKGSAVEWIEIRDDETEKVGRVDSFTVDRIRLSLFSQEEGPESKGAESVVGRLLELDLASRSFRVHGAGDVKTVIEYDDLLEPIVRDALKLFVSARVSRSGAATRLLSLEALDDVPESRFNERRSLDEVIAEQGGEPLRDFDSLALEDQSDAVPEREFISFIRTLRRGLE